MRISDKTEMWESREHRLKEKNLERILILKLCGASESPVEVTEEAVGVTSQVPV